MSYIGSSATPLPVNFSAVQSQGFNGTGSQTTFTLNRSVGSAASVEVLVNNVQQSPYDGSYNITGGTSLVFSEAPSAGTNNVYVVYRDQALGSLVDTTAYRKAEVDSAVAAKVSKTGDTMTGRLTISAGADRSIDLLNSSGVTQGYIGVEGAFGGAPSNALRLRGEGGVVLGANGTALLTCDSSGRVSTPYQPAFYAYWANDQFNYGSGITYWDATRFNIGGHYNPANGRFTAPVAGVYHFALQCQHYASTASNGFQDIMLNAGYINARYEHTSGGTWQASGISVDIYMNAGDYVYCNSNAAIWWSDNSFFSGFFVG